METHDSEMVFQWDKLKDACRSFVDSIVIELCFPRAPYPRFVLFQLLRDAIAESPKDAERISQELSNAIGDLSVRFSLLYVKTIDLMTALGRGRAAGVVGRPLVGSRRQCFEDRTSRYT
jgi:hypothetical protein